MAEPIGGGVATRVTQEWLDELEAHVQNRVGGRLMCFSLSTNGEGLVLHGCARTYYAKQLAQQAVTEATVLPIISNEIEVT